LAVDVWSATGEDKAGIRAAVDYVAPYADPERKWPHKQIRPGVPATLGPLLRRAAIVSRVRGTGGQALSDRRSGA
jgi:hypothetical protein